MAVISKFIPVEGSIGHRQPTTVECAWRGFDADEGRMLQLDTFGSTTRKHPGKQSQTLQLDRSAALELVAIIHRVFADTP
ncbi:MAG TPA: hypothetical protein VH702_15215 [Vicinamibacterales bacterium]|jgi:hypothetical protein